MVGIVVSFSKSAMFLISRVIGIEEKYLPDWLPPISITGETVSDGKDHSPTVDHVVTLQQLLGRKVISPTIFSTLSLYTNKGSPIDSHIPWR